MVFPERFVPGMKPFQAFFPLFSEIPLEKMNGACYIKTFTLLMAAPELCCLSGHRAINPTRPAGIIRMLDLRRPIYRQTAAYGHFGRTDIDLPWEHTDKADTLKQQAGL